jgi:hypothetical protein
MNWLMAIGSKIAINNISMVRLAIFLVMFSHLTVKYLSLRVNKSNHGFREMLSLIGYVFSLMLLILGLKKAGFSLLGAILLTSLAVGEGAVSAENAVALIAVWIYAFILLLSKLRA